MPLANLIPILSKKSTTNSPTMSPTNSNTTFSLEDTSSAEAQAQPSQHTPFPAHKATPLENGISLLEQETGDVASNEAQAQPMEHVPASEGAAKISEVKAKEVEPTEERGSWTSA
ncbi:hypothetical protein TI39_contig5875g00006 [Zymoseptoria brevis]|uniref:Uncharacterized protein n=1 Tax=Zymoseptoria brevis TaxID=1047168 RepID=A0A0F4G4K7_9PEZI|nr:hypothetical protein TI39_contig5875g00006 [Zymoseptoria brevis]